MAIWHLLCARHSKYIVHINNTKEKGMIIPKFKVDDSGNSLVVQWLGLCAFTA